MEMTPDQIEKLLTSLNKIAEGLAANQTYTITGAADWPLLVAFGSVGVLLIGFMWRDLRGVVKEQKSDNGKEHDALWQALRDCKEDCCPARKKL